MYKLSHTASESWTIWLNTLRPRQNGRHFPDDIIKCIFLNENFFFFLLKCPWILFLRVQLKTRTTRTPAFWGYPPPPHDYPFYRVMLDPKSKEDKVKVTNLKNSPKFKFFEFSNGHYTGHTFWSCLIRCANMKWIRWVLLKIQSGHDSVHRRTDGETDRRTRWYQYTPLSTSLKRGV